MHQECNWLNCSTHGSTVAQIAKFYLLLEPVVVALLSFAVLSSKRKSKKKQQVENRKAVWLLLKPLSIKLNVCVCAAHTLLLCMFHFQFSRSTDHFDANATALHYTEEEEERSDCSALSGRKLLVSGALLACCDHHWWWCCSCCFLF